MSNNEYESVQADAIDTSVTDEEMLAVFAPLALKEGPLLIEFKNLENNGIKDAVILTLNENECPIDQRPESENIEYTWCWNVRTNQWYKLDFSKIESMQPWPPELLD
jgi:hypothetical protein